MDLRIILGVVGAVVVAIDGPGLAMHEEDFIWLELDQDHSSLVDLVHRRLINIINLELIYCCKVNRSEIGIKSPVVS